MNRFILIAIILTLVFSSCRRNRETITQVNGKVMDRETLDSLPGAAVFFFKKNRISGVITEQGEVIADDNGNYVYAFNADDNYYYYVTASSGNYLIVDYNLVQRGMVNNNENIYLAKPGYLAVHIKNVNPFDSTDKISVFESDYYYLDFVFTGDAVDTTLILTTYGNQANPVNWRVTRNDTTTTYNQTVNYISLDTVYIDLFY